MHKVSLSFVALCAFAQPSVAWAQDADAGPGSGTAASAGEIVVTGRGLPAAPGTPAYGVVVVTGDALQTSASNRIEAVLSEVAGFQQFRRSDSRSANPSAQGATLRALGGNAASRTLVMLDGVPLADPFFGNIPFSALVPDRLGEVRVQRGGGLGAFGAGAVAGTIELTSAARHDLPLLAASGFYGSNDSSELAASVSPNLGGGFVTLAGRWDRGDGFQTTPLAQRTAATVPARYDSWSMSLRGVAPLSATTELQFRGLVFDDHRTLRFAGADTASEGQEASVRLVSRGTWQIDALGYVQMRNFSNVVISSGTFRRSLDQRSTPATGIGGKLELRPPVGANHVLRLGIDTRFASGTMFEDAYNANVAANPLTASRKAGGRSNTTGVFIEDDWTLGRLILTGGVRADHWSIGNGFFQSQNTAGILTIDNHFADRDGWRASFRAGAVVHVSSALALRAAGYTGFRLPTLNELYRPFTVFPVTTQANAALGLERLKGGEAGFDFSPTPGFALNVTGFYNRLDGAIANVTVAANLRQRRNVGAIVAKGVEVTASARFGDVTLATSYAYSNSKVRAPGLAFDGFAPAQSPHHAASATLAWSPRHGPSLSATLHYVAAQFEDDLQTDVLPRALTVDAVARLPLGPHLSVIGRVENLFDEAVVTRNVAGSIDLGAPQTFWIGLRFSG